MANTNPSDGFKKDADYPRCGRRNKNCQCGYRYSAQEYEVWNCPGCGTSRACRNRVAKAGDACKRKHGGATPAGIESPHYQGKGYSKHMAAELVDAYNEAIDNPGLLSLREDMALDYMRVQALVGKIDVPGALWRKLAERLRR